MREYIFRGKRKGDKEWQFGHLHIIEWDKPAKAKGDYIDYRILGRHNECCYVDPETVGQYTGHICKNGKLFEGDIVKYKNSPPNLIRWNQDISGFEAAHVRDGVEYTCGICKVEDVEIIGNIHDNKEILEEGGEE